MDKTLEEIVKRRARKAMAKACALVERDAKLKCPVDSGHLRNSIEYEIEEDGDTIIGIVKATAPYAAYVEYGTGVKAEGGNGRKTPWTYYDDELEQFITTAGQAPQPFLRPALEENKYAIDDIIMEGVVSKW